MKILRNRITTLVLAIILGSGCSTVWTVGEVVFIPTPIAVVDRMLELAEIKKGDVVYDLGSGDGRIVIRAAKKYGTRGVGVEIDSRFVERSRAKAGEEGVSHLVEFQEQDALTVDLSPATIVTLYMSPEFNAKLRPILLQHLRPGARVVSHDFGMDGWLPDKVESMDGGYLHEHTIYLWKIQPTKRGQATFHRW